MDELILLLKTLDMPLFYAVADENQAMPYMVYNDYSEYYSKADNRISEVVTNIQVDFYTNIPFDDKKWLIRQTLDSAEIPFSYQLLYDDEERVYHHIFDCEVVERGN